MITFTKAEFDHLEALTALRTLVMAEDFKRHELDPGRTKQYFAKSYDPEYTYIVHAGENFIGCVSVHPGEEYDDELKHFYINPEYQGKGYGTLILKKMIAEQREKNRDLSLYVFKGSQAIPMYKRYGFRVIEVGDFTERLLLELRDGLTDER